MYYTALPLLTVVARITQGKQIEHELNHWQTLPMKVIPETRAPQKCMKLKCNGGEGNNICQILLALEATSSTTNTEPAKAL